MTLSLNQKILYETITSVPAFRPTGKIESFQGLISVSLPIAVGELCQIIKSDGSRLLAEVIGFSGKRAQVIPFGPSDNLHQGAEVIALQRSMRVPVGNQLLGRVLNAMGQPIDQGSPISGCQYISVVGDPPDVLQRQPIEHIFPTGQRAIDGMLTLGYGQRVGLFAGSGVGKSTLLGQIARYAQADVNVVALVGERGREVLPFVQSALGVQGMAKSVVIVATADESPLLRIRAAETALAMAEHFRDQGQRVMLMLDSLTRLAMAQRELGLLLGEPPTARGYTPSVFNKIAVLLERMGNSDRGSITGVITVLVEGDDMNDPIADTARSILDGHIVLSRKLANAGHFPAIDIMSSNSRLFHDLADPQQLKSTMLIRQLLARYDEVVDLLQVGAYQKGVSVQTDTAINMHPEINQFLQQELNQPQTLEITQRTLNTLAIRANHSSQAPSPPPPQPP